MTSSIQVSEEVFEAGRKEILRFEDRDDIREILPRVYLAMRSKDHSIAVDEVREDAVERVARALHEHEDSWNDIAWEYLPFGTQELFESQARAAITAIGSQSIEGERAK